MKRLFNFFATFTVTFFLLSCTVYTEKQSRELSRTVYATSDSLDKARLDLAVEYSTQTTRLVKPPKPKDRIVIDSIYAPSTIPVIASSAATSKQQKPNRQRVIVVPEMYKNDTVVVVNSSEYQQLLKDKQVYEQLQTDYKTLNKAKTDVDEELAKQEKYNNQMIQDLNRMQKQLVEKDLAILKRNIVIVVLLLMGAGGVYLRMKGIL